MNALLLCRPAGPARFLFLLVSLSPVLLQPGTAADQAEVEKLFHAAEGKKEDKKAGQKLIALGDQAVDFLCGLIRDKKKREIEITSVDGREKIMASWGQEAGGYLMAIDTPKVIEELRKLARHEDAEVRYWGIRALRSCDTEREENLAFFRSRLELETGSRGLQELVDIIADRLDPADMPVFKKLEASARDLHVKLALWHAMAQQGEKDALLEIVKVCEQRSGHYGVGYLERATGQDFGWDTKAWRKWLEGVSAEEFRNLAARRRPPPLPAPLPGRPAYPLPDGISPEIREALAWFDSLGLPSVKGLKRVRVTDESSNNESKSRRTTHVSGWLLVEKNGTWRILAGADARGPFFWDGKEAWPMQEWEVKEHDTTHDGWRSVRRVETTDFKNEAEAILAGLDSNEDSRHNRFGMVLSQRAAVFLAGRDCLELGHTELGMKLLSRAPSLWRDVSELRSLGQMLSDEFAQSALWRITLDFGVPSITRKALLAKLETASKQFPANWSADGMKAMAERLRTMIAADQAHAAAAKPFDTMTPEEQAAELVFQLRDQTGRQDSQPGWCDIFQGADGKENESSPATRLVKLGHAAVPALIEALGCEDHSRAVGFWRAFQFSHTVLTTGDCALAVLQRIAGQQFFAPKTTSSYMSTDDKVNATREAVEAWWAGAKKKSS